MSEIYQVRIGELLLDSMLTQHPIKFQEVEGWRGVPSSRGRTDSIPGAHGAFPRSPVLRSERLITVKGFVRTSSHGETTAICDEMSQMLEQESVMRVEDEQGIWCREVELNRFVPDDPKGTGFARFVIDLTSHDPLRYREPVTLGPVGLPVREGGLVFPAEFPWNFGAEMVAVQPATNDGAVPVHPVIRVEGSASSLVVFGGPRRLEFGAFTGVLVLDSLQRRAWLNGVDVTIDMVRRDWFVIEPDTTENFSFTAANPVGEPRLWIDDFKIGAW